MLIICVSISDDSFRYNDCMYYDSKKDRKEHSGLDTNDLFQTLFEDGEVGTLNCETVP